MRNSLFVRLGLVFSCLLLGLGSSCTQKSKDSSAPGAESSSSSGQIVNLAIWSNYISPDLLEEFRKRTGIKVQIANYSSNEELLAKLEAGASGYDVAVPSDYMVLVMNKLGLIRELDYSLLSSTKFLDPKFLKKNYDPENKHSVPYNWGTTGIAVNRSLFKGQIRGWKDLFENESLAGKFSLLDDSREVIGLALKTLGFSMNSKNPEELAKAKELLFKIRKKVKAFTSEPLMPLINGETAVAQAFMSDALQARKATGGKIEYLVPEEGGTLWVDSLVIPVGSTHVKEAHALINFLLEGKSAVSMVENIFVAPVSTDAYRLLPKEFKTNPMLFPPPPVLARCEMIQDLGEFLSVWDRIWTEVKAH